MDDITRNILQEILKNKQEELEDINKSISRVEETLKYHITRKNKQEEIVKCLEKDLGRQ